jgi:hypothetical protein
MFSSSESNSDYAFDRVTFSFILSIGKCSTVKCSCACFEFLATCSKLKSRLSVSDGDVIAMSLAYYSRDIGVK